MMFRNMILTAILFIAVAAQAQSQTLRSIELNASIRDPAGLPLPDVSLGIRNDVEVHRKASHAHFDAAGNTTTTVQVPVDASYLMLTLGPALREPIHDPENSAIMNRFKQLKDSISFRPRYRVPLVASQTTYSIVLQGVPSITVTGRLVSPDGTPLPGSIWARGSWGSTGLRAPTDGNFSLKGVALGESTELVCQEDGFGARMLPLTAQQTAANLDLGDVVMQPIEPQCRVQVRLVPPRGTVTLVSSTTGQIMTFLANSNGAIATPSTGLTGASVPQGEYLVAPGSLMIDDEPLQLYDLIRAGRADDHPELTSFVASPTEEVSMTIDPKETAQKIKAAAIAEAISPNP